VEIRYKPYAAETTVCAAKALWFVLAPQARHFINRRITPPPEAWSVLCGIERRLLALATGRRL
jgi:hypothetical protein